MLLRVSESIDDVHCNDCVLNLLINLRFQISRVEDIILKNGNGIDEVLMTELDI